jgi:hypothetical protein
MDAENPDLLTMMHRRLPLPSQMDAITAAAAAAAIFAAQNRENDGSVGGASALVTSFMSVLSTRRTQTSL